MVEGYYHHMTSPYTDYEQLVHIGMYGSISIPSLTSLPSYCLTSVCISLINKFVMIYKYEVVL